ncbi:hypothetical protein CPLU01_08229 [Colletotrichum plurivorum]|uniref:Uncharacterized protein n=1 Tax=Colletotrichum plurivorum TaxID=2175906 RepID=A0A8H6NDI0_9PEZI|nr:hypothetical protein CPLU01_08229 [Colletotrichum plurivorum]
MADRPKCSLRCGVEPADLETVNRNPGRGQPAQAVDPVWAHRGDYDFRDMLDLDVSVFPQRQVARAPSRSAIRAFARRLPPFLALTVSISGWLRTVLLLALVQGPPARSSRTGAWRRDECSKDDPVLAARSMGRTRKVDAAEAKEQRKSSTIGRNA